MRLEGKTAIVTGAASGLQGEVMGYGGATARIFSKEGANVIIADLKDEIGEKTASQIRDGGGSAKYVHLDVTSEHDWINAIEVATSEFGELNILVNNAGIGDPSIIEETSVDSWNRQMDIMAKGTFLGTKYAIPEMRKVGGGSIVNVSSVFGNVGSLGDSVYSAAKGAVRTFTKATAVQHAKDGIRANSVHPGWGMTPMTVDPFSDPDILDPKLATVPIGRLARPEEIGYGILFFASDEASFATGAELVIDGGRIAW